MNRDIPDDVFLDNVSVIIFQVVDMSYDTLIDSCDGVAVTDTDTDRLEFFGIYGFLFFFRLRI